MSDENTQSSDAGADRFPSLGLARGTVELVPYDPQWRDEYEREVERLHSRLGEEVNGFEHVGSTSVPGLAAKPIVDLIALVPDLGDTNDVARVLEDSGYEERPNDEVPDRRFFARGPPPCRTHYLSVTERGSDCHREQVAFRDALRSDDDLAAEYERRKQALAAVHPDGRDAYTESKSSFVQSVLQKVPQAVDDTK
ncbi:GrpB family protein [Haloferax mediterranei ATCC 33500]|uniref:Glutamate-rich protein grpB n=1 Tax=Haloferax mediterranei (strain ATCC 33500 / DSM 1411 / JCM 8866 / NBRC 14739 / NCIMB 2177 / R-4) TaxID=523841 RepID=I3R2F8_HALMT|nr:GrpB family protein [Haloferax mediterranei]AFK18418.1 Glutamate-rich protein grpB [Haloferax mediterranei ATCC 33500]AHZ22191.1 hypothetical protein BM92_05760 [Haloferax mediterranei ATCC 33500]EMA02306.1 Glutamate-rich protein grpB [Haloferax mediterranei ATCC 33500]MDX5988510.1 GrpB family protein [Haloferax mediterranei ATCC 33500]QCQ74926.1 GrpB family protein [Haloferax mediterranei ATCC 33500]